MSDILEEARDRAFKAMEEKRRMETQDPWKHRSKGLRCESCMWFVIKINRFTNLPVIGRCRRHAPAMSGYPVVFADDWCGDHKLDENKV